MFPKGKNSVWALGIEVTMQFGFKCKMQLGNDGPEPTEREMNAVAVG
jgi:hypothetical protein